MWSSCRPTRYGMSIGARGALAVYDEHRSLDPCRPFLIGGHTWGSEHLKLFLTQRNRIEAVLAPGTCHFAARCGAGASSLCLLPRSFQNHAELPDNPLTADAQADAQTDAQANADADADAPAAACSLGSPPLSASPLTHTHTPTHTLLVSFTPALPLLCFRHLHFAAVRVVHSTPRWAHQVAHTLNLDSHRDCSPRLRHSLRRGLQA